MFVWSFFITHRCACVGSSLEIIRSFVVQLSSVLQSPSSRSNAEKRNSCRVSVVSVVNFTRLVKANWTKCVVSAGKSHFPEVWSSHRVNIYGWSLPLAKILAGPWPAKRNRLWICLPWRFRWGPTEKAQETNGCPCFAFSSCFFSIVIRRRLLIIEYRILLSEWSWEEIYIFDSAYSLDWKVIK